MNYFTTFGEELLVKTINSNFGLNITEYVTIDFLGLVNVINSIGGIKLTISEDEMRVINQYLIEIYALEGMPYQEMTVCGDVILTGEQAVGHCRNRFVGSDFTRAKRQRDVITAIINKVAQMDTQDAINCIDYFLAQIQTNVNVQEYISISGRTGELIKLDTKTPFMISVLKKLENETFGVNITPYQLIEEIEIEYEKQAMFTLATKEGASNITFSYDDAIVYPNDTVYVSANIVTDERFTDETIDQIYNHIKIVGNNRYVYIKGLNNNRYNMVG